MILSSFDPFRSSLLGASESRIMSSLAPMPAGRSLEDAYFAAAEERVRRTGKAEQAFPNLGSPVLDDGGVGCHCEACQYGD